MVHSPAWYPWAEDPWACFLNTPFYICELKDPGFRRISDRRWWFIYKGFHSAGRTHSRCSVNVCNHPIPQKLALPPPPWFPIPCVFPLHLRSPAPEWRRWHSSYDLPQLWGLECCSCVNQVGEGKYLEIQPQEVINDFEQLFGSTFLITSQPRS